MYTQIGQIRADRKQLLRRGLGSALILAVVTAVFGGIVLAARFPAHSTASIGTTFSLIIGFFGGLYGHEGLHWVLFKVCGAKPQVQSWIPWRLSVVGGGVPLTYGRDRLCRVGPGVVLTAAGLLLLLVAPWEAAATGFAYLAANIIGSTPA